MPCGWKVTRRTIRKHSEMKSWWVIVGVWAAVGVGVSAARTRGLFTRDLDRPDRIVGGEPVKKGSFPWQVSLQLGTHHFCGGTLVAKTLVITAAHCTLDFDMNSVRVVTGAWDLKNRKNQRRHRIVHVTAAEYNQSTLEKDIALLWIEEESRTSNRVELPHGVPISIETRKDSGVGERCFISGWGRTANGGSLPSLLMAADVELRSDEECRKMFGSYAFYTIHPSNLCAGGGPRDACQGDSGGPLVCCGNSMDPSTCVLKGVTSWGIGCATKGIPGVYTEVAYYHDWIKKAVDMRDGERKSTILSFYGRA